MTDSTYSLDAYIKGNATIQGYLSNASYVYEQTINSDITLTANTSLISIYLLTNSTTSYIVKLPSSSYYGRFIIVMNSGNSIANLVIRGQSAYSATDIYDYPNNPGMTLSIGKSVILTSNSTGSYYYVISKT